MLLGIEVCGWQNIRIESILKNIFTKRLTSMVLAITNSTGCHQAFHQVSSVEKHFTIKYNFDKSVKFMVLPYCCKHRKRLTLRSERRYPIFNKTKSINVTQIKTRLVLVRGCGYLRTHKDITVTPFVKKHFTKYTNNR